jgi:hypothetical protein
VRDLVLHSVKYELTELLERNTVLSFDYSQDVGINIPDYAACVHNRNFINRSGLKFRPSYPGTSACGDNLNATGLGTPEDPSSDSTNERKRPFVESVQLERSDELKHPFFGCITIDGYLEQTIQLGNCSDDALSLAVVLFVESFRSVKEVLNIECCDLHGTTSAVSR